MARSVADRYRLVGLYTGRILQRSKSPPISRYMQPTKFELAVNLKAAQALGHYCTGSDPSSRHRGDRMRRREFIGRRDRCGGRSISCSGTGCAYR